MTEQKRPRGRPPYQPTEKDRRQIRLLCGFGLTDEEIAAVIGIGIATLKKYYECELKSGAPEVIAQVANSLLKMATHPEKPNVTAAIFWLKCRAGWVDTPVAASQGKKELAALEAERIESDKAGSKWAALLN